MVTISLGYAGMLPVYIPVSFICVLIATLIGVIMDSISPYTVWSDELSALRGNLNCFFNLAAEMIAALAVGAGSYGLCLLIDNSFIVILSISIVLILACVIGVLVGLPKAGKNIESLS